MEDNIIRFCEEYITFVNWARNKYSDELREEMWYDTNRDIRHSGNPDPWYLEKLEALDKFKDDLCFFRKLRNLIAHERVCGYCLADLISIKQDALDALVGLSREIEKPVLERAINVKDIIYRSLKDNVMDAVREMFVANITHMPILQDGKLVGLFSENTLFVMTNSGYDIDGETTFEDIMEYIRLDRSDSHFIISQDRTIPDCRYYFSSAIKDNHRLDILFITEDGTAETPLMGLITVWDLAKL